MLIAVWYCNIIVRVYTVFKDVLIKITSPHDITKDLVKKILRKPFSS